MPLSQETINRLDAHNEKTKPRPYDLTNPDERARLLHESAGYACVSLHYGTDKAGREYAADALNAAIKLGYRLVPPEATNAD